MLVVLLDWLYILFITASIGYGFLMLYKHITQRRIPKSAISYIVTGIVITTVYTEIFSLFYRVQLLANAILIILSLIVIYKYHKQLLAWLSNYRKKEWHMTILLYLFCTLFVAFFTSRGTIHTDTSMYHAQAIRWYEEYGVVPGLGNLQNHFAYNSAYFAFAALFSMGKILAQPLHCTTGFIEIVLCIWALSILRNLKHKTTHLSDFGAIAILFYALVNLCGSISPASDYGTMFLTLYLITRWAEEIENNCTDANIYGLLCVLAAFIVTCKLSTGLLVLLAIYPLILLIKGKDIKGICIYLCMGLIVVCPFLIRNVIISGWLLYPFSELDLFSVDWKIPERIVISDSNQIKVWGRCTYDVSLINQSLKEWIPIWWENQERYAQMLILTNLLAIILQVAKLIHLIANKMKIRWNLLLLNFVVAICAITWFLMAPFIRYGLAFLLAFPMLAVGNWLQEEKSSLYKLFSGCVVALMFFILTPYWDHYFVDDMVFFKQRLLEPYYIEQCDYSTSEMQEFNVEGITFYSPIEGEITGYQYFPSTSYTWNIHCMEFRGERIEDGFRYKE